jgi:hypothetical protein
MRNGFAWEAWLLIHIARFVPGLGLILARHFCTQYFDKKIKSKNFDFDKKIFFF